MDAIEKAKADPNKRKKKKKFKDPLVLDMIREYKSNIVESRKVYKREKKDWDDVADPDSWDDDESI